MAKGINQKLKLLYIVKILEKKTDEDHPMSTKQLIDELAKYEIGAERKSIYDDIAQLIEFGYDIVTNKSKKDGGYYMASRQFELSEMKLLVDSIQASKFITVKKSRELIAKLEDIVSEFDEAQLKRDIFVQNRVKTDNESIYYVVNDIYAAMQNNKQISFKYLDWTPQKEKVARHDGQLYFVSPFALTFKDENYYMIAYDSSSQKIKHYRVDKIKGVSLLNESRKGNDLFEKFDVASYANRSFGMYGGEVKTVTLRVQKESIGIVIDRFGTDINIREEKGDCLVRTPVAISNQFFGWITSLGGAVLIDSPKDVKDSYLTFLKEILDKQNK
jgi:predicted DNA-binding transcriptional regulator YafY